MSDDTKTPAERALGAVRADAVLRDILRCRRCGGKGTTHRPCSMCHDSTWDHECDDEDRVCITCNGAGLDAGPGGLDGLLAACRAVDPEHARLVADVEALRAQLAAANERAAQAWEDGKNAVCDFMQAKVETCRVVAAGLADRDVAGAMTREADNTTVLIRRARAITPPEAPDA